MFQNFLNFRRDPPWLTKILTQPNQTRGSTRPVDIWELNGVNAGCVELVCLTRPVWRRSRHTRSKCVSRWCIPYCCVLYWSCRTRLSSCSFKSPTICAKCVTCLSLLSRWSISSRLSLTRLSSTFCSCTTPPLSNHNHWLRTVTLYTYTKKY